MAKRSRDPAARGPSRQTIYGYLLLAAAPLLLVGLAMMPNHKIMRGWETADQRFVFGYYVAVVGAILAAFAITAMLVDHAGGKPQSSRHVRDEGDDEA